MLVCERPSYHGMQYELYDSETFGPQQQPRRVSRKIAEHDKLELNQLDKSIPVRIKKTLYSLIYYFFNFSKTLFMQLFFFVLMPFSMHQ